MKAYKGFNKDMTCRDFQYKEGETYHEDKAELCESGFHACEDPLDCFGYYPPATSVFHEVELDEVSDERKDDSKVVAKTIKVGAEIGLPIIARLHFEYVRSRCNPVDGRVAGDRESVSVGEKASASAGESGSAVSRGSSASGENGISVARGNYIKVKGGLGALLVAAEERKDDYNIESWSAAIVDGDKIKADTWYTVKDGKFVEIKEA